METALLCTQWLGMTGKPETFMRFPAFQQCEAGKEAVWLGFWKRTTPVVKRSSEKLNE